MRAQSVHKRSFFRAILLGIGMWAFAQVYSQGHLQETDTLELPSTRLIDPSELPVDNMAFNFLAGGHWYGAHENVNSKLPAATLYASIGLLNAQNPDWVFILGDAVRDANDDIQINAFQDFQRQLKGRHQMIPGNHDLYKEKYYDRGLGKWADYAVIKGTPHVFLNTESLRFGGGKYMLQMLKVVGREISGNTSRNLFVYSHRLLWALTEPGFAEMDDFANQPFAPDVNADTLQMVYDAILKMAGPRNLHWFSGDIGASWSETAFYDHSKDGKRHFYAAGLGDCVDDAMWSIHVSGDGTVSRRLLLLNGHNPHSDDYYGLKEWRIRMQARQGLGKSTLGKKIKQYISVPKFWVGMAIGFALALGVTFVLRKLKAAR